MIIYRKFNTYIRNRRGATAVELALTFPFFLLILMVILETTLFFFASSNAEQVVHNHSRRLILMTSRPSQKDTSVAIENEIAELINPSYFRSFRFAIDTATPTTDFKRSIRQNHVGRFYLNKKDQPLYFRVVFQRNQFTYQFLRPIWRLIGNPRLGGLYAPIDVLIVLPFPPSDQ